MAISATVPGAERGGRALWGPQDEREEPLLWDSHTPSAQLGIRKCLVRVTAQRRGRVRVSEVFAHRLYLTRLAYYGRGKECRKA